MSSVRLVPEFLERSAERWPDKVALVCQKRRLTWGELDARADRIARGLRSRGVVRGDRVVIYGDNSVDLVAGVFGTLKADAAFIVANGAMRAEKLAYVLGDSRATALLPDSALAPHWTEALRTLGETPSRDHLRTVLVMSGLSEGDPEPAAHNARERGFVRAESLTRTERDADGPRLARGNVDLDLAMIIYTSGSTGEPKGAMLSHRNVEFASWSVTTLLENTPDDVILGVVPLAFNYGLYQLLMTARLGATLVLERGFSFPLQCLARVAEERVTGFPGVPTMFAMLDELRADTLPDLSSVRYVTSTAAQLLPRHVSAIQRIFPGSRVYSMYGLTECKRVSWLPPADLERKPDRVGLPIPGTEFWVVDPDSGRKLDPGEPGELVVRGSHVMVGYWDKPELTAQYLRPGPLPGERLFYTGDLCEIDEEGHLRFIARMDEVIKSKGEKVAPREVEKAIEHIEGVRECAVIGVDDPILGSAIKAFVVMQDDARGRYTERDIMLRCGQRVESYMVPRHVVFLDTLPKTSMGKILKKGLT